MGPAKNFAILLVAVTTLLLLSGPVLAEPCNEENLPGPWKSVTTSNIWTFAANGDLSCSGPCRFIEVTGKPVYWAYEPNANLWSRPIEHVKLVFERATFDGIFGSFKCLIEDEGRTLRLVSEDEGAMGFTRQ